MDFAVCPACGQSVLEDDAENCPFCGSSMKAKPGVKPSGAAKPAATAAAAPAVKPAAKAPTKPADDDLPFDAETNLPQTAIPVSPAPTKSKSLKVVCPMCDTAGYVAPSAAGKQVRCANAKCHMPIFTVPAPEPEAAPPPPPNKGNPIVLGLITAVVVSAIGGAWFIFASKPTNTAPDVKPLTPEDIAKMKQGGPSGTTDPQTTTDVTTTTDTQPATTKTDTTPVGPTVDALIAQAVKMMPEVSVQSSQNRSKPYCRRLAAETAALAGDVPAAREHLDQLLKTGGQDLAFYRIGPLVQLFWLEHAKNNANAAQEFLNQAVADSARLPKIGRDQMDLATQLAAALVAAGRAKEARELIESHQTPGVEGEASAYLQVIAADSTLIDARKRIELRPIVFRQAPQAASTTGVLVLKGQPAAALDWAKGWEEPHVRAQCLIALAEASVAGLASEVPEADIAGLAPESQLLLRARLARMQAARGQADAAKAALAKAAASLESITPPAEFALPDRKEMTKWRPAADEALVTLAAGAAELAVAQHVVGQDNAAAAKALEVSLQACRALGPAIAVAEKLQQEADNLGPVGLRQKLKEELELRNDDLARQAVPLYRRAVGDLVGIAQHRFSLQTNILSRAAQLGLEDAVWVYVSSRTADTDPARREPYFPTDVTSWLVERFRARGANDMVAAVTAAAASAVRGEIKRPVVAEFEEHIGAGRLKEAVTLLQRSDVKSELRETLALIGALRLATQDPIDETWKFISQLGDVVLREQSWEWSALIAARRGQGAAVSKQLASIPGATEKISLGRGLVAGLAPQVGKK